MVKTATGTIIVVEVVKHIVRKPIIYDKFIYDSF
jgi:hypothetical protein